MKFLLTLLFCCGCLTSFSQNSNTYFMKFDGHEVSIRDSADYIRIITEPEAGDKYYTMTELLPDGHKLAVGKVSTITPLILQGQFINYYSNGNRKKIATYVNGIAVNQEYNYYPNGNLRNVLQHPETPEKYTSHGVNSLIKFFYDTVGTEIVSNGKGYVKYYNADHSKVVEEGPLDNGVKEGEWKGTSEYYQLQYVEEYKAGNLISGTATDAAGKSTTYSEHRYTPPKFTNAQVLYRTTRTYMVYPPKAIAEKKQGTVWVKFKVAPDGTMSDFTIQKSVSPELDAEAIRVAKLLPLWRPGTSFGRIESAYISIPVPLV